jgi:hypothetical protein
MAIEVKSRVRFDTGFSDISFHEWISHLKVLVVTGEFRDAVPVAARHQGAGEVPT